MPFCALISKSAGLIPRAFRMPPPVAPDPAVAAPAWGLSLGSISGGGAGCGLGVLYDCPVGFAYMFSDMVQKERPLTLFFGIHIFARNCCVVREWGGCCLQQSPSQLLACYS